MSDEIPRLNIHNAPKLSENDIRIEPGQIWRKLGPYDWIKITHIEDPRYPNYDGGLIGVGVIAYPPQFKGIKLRGGHREFWPGKYWEEHVRNNRFLLEEGQPVNML